MAHVSKSKKQKRLDVRTDFISELPREVQDGIMVCLPLRDAARMSVLSHKWHDIWTSIPQLKFDNKFFTTVFRHTAYGRKKLSTHEFGNIVSKILLQHEGNLLKFSLDVPSLDSSPDISHWISQLSRTGIRDFSLTKKTCISVIIKLTSRLFSCHDLENLNLEGCHFSVPANFHGFPKLISLQLADVDTGGKAITDLIAGSQQLEKLSLKSRIPTPGIVIDAPNLSCLIVGNISSSLEIRNVESLVSVSIGYPSGAIIGSLSSLVEVLATARKLEKLQFGVSFCRELFKQGLIPTTFRKIVNLKMSINLSVPDDYSAVISAIQSCPNIEELDISVQLSEKLDGCVKDYNIRLDNLRRANIVLRRGSAIELKLIELLLGCSPVMEKLLVTIPRVKKDSQIEMLLQMQRFRRASHKVEVICSKNANPIPFRSSKYGRDSSSTESSSESSSDSSD